MSYDELVRWCITFTGGAVILLGALFLLGCGKKEDPLPPGPKEESYYPRVYPAE